MTSTKTHGHYSIVTTFDDGTLCYNGRYQDNETAWLYADLMNSVDDVFTYGVTFVGKNEGESSFHQGSTEEEEEYNGWKVSL